MPLDGKHSLTFKKDPQTDRKAMIASMKGFKDSQFVKNYYKDSDPKTQIDEFYTPHKGGVKK